jgi:ankyrin repeat protein
VLHCSASHGHDAVLDYFIRSSDSTLIDSRDRNGDTPLFYAVTFGHFVCAKMLLTNGANANSQVSWR